MRRDQRWGLGWRQELGKSSVYREYLRPWDRMRTLRSRVEREDRLKEASNKTEQGGRSQWENEWLVGWENKVVEEAKRERIVFHRDIWMLLRSWVWGSVVCPLDLAMWYDAGGIQTDGRMGSTKVEVVCFVFLLWTHVKKNKGVLEGYQRKYSWVSCLSTSYPLYPYSLLTFS